MLQGPDKGECEGDRDRCNVIGCPKFGALGRLFRDGRRRVRGCGDPAARGKRNRATGDSKARRVRKSLAIAGVNSRHEEVTGGALRWENKAGAKANMVRTQYVNSENQSEVQRPLGDVRPFVATFSPDGWSDDLIVLRASKQIEVAIAILANHGYTVKERDAWDSSTG